MDKYARLMQKLEIVNVEFFKVPILILGILRIPLLFNFFSKVSLTPVLKYVGNMPIVWGLFLLRVSSFWSRTY